MCLLKRHNDKRTEGRMTKETGDIMRLLKRHNDKRAEGKMTEETREAMAKDWKVKSISYLFLYQIPCKDTLETNYLCIFADSIRCLKGGVTYWWTIIITLVILWFTDFYQISIHTFFISFIGIELHVKDISDYGRNSFTLQMVRIYVCLDAGVSTSSSRRKSIRAVYLYPFISSNSAQWLLRI